MGWAFAAGCIVGGAVFVTLALILLMRPINPEDRVPETDLKVALSLTATRMWSHQARALDLPAWRDLTKEQQAEVTEAARTAITTFAESM